MNKPLFIAIDGESFVNSEQETIYNILLASDGTYVEYSKGRGLDTLDCFEFLIGLAQRNPKATFVSFYFNYDVNCMLVNVPPFLAMLLAKNGHVYLYPGIGFEDPNGGYKLTYLPKKIFILERGYTNVISTVERKWVCEDSITIYDVWGFFQSGFSPAIDELGVGTKEDRDFIRDMKAERNEFDIKKIEKILDYCFLECEYLVLAMNKLADAFWDCGLELTSWHGAGAIGNLILGQHGVKNLVCRPKDPEFQNAVLCAYFGGRIQSVQLGEFESGLVQYDLVSAYPWGMSNLPDLSDCFELEITPDSPYWGMVMETYGLTYMAAVYHITWDIRGSGSNIGPFPFRDDTGSIYYPLSGEGHYWTPEIASCQKVYGDCFTILKVYAFVPRSDISRPFSWVEEIFNARSRLKREGNHAQLGYKLGLTSLYGKFCQGNINGSPPKFQSYAYAGLITSQVRAKVFELAMQDHDNCIAFSTDGVFFQDDAELFLTEGKSLGDWEETSYHSGTFIMPGVYFLNRFYQPEIGPPAKPHDKSRGFPIRQANRQAFIDEWRNNGVCGKVKLLLRNFIGIKSASQKRPWRTWVNEPKEISFWPSRGVPIYQSENPPIYSVEPEHGMTGCSRPYVGKDILKVADNPQDLTLSYDDVIAGFLADDMLDKLG